MDKEFSFDNTILGEECDVMFNQHMSQRELKLIDSLIEVYADVLRILWDMVRILFAKESMRNMRMSFDDEIRSSLI